MENIPTSRSLLNQLENDCGDAPAQILQRYENRIIRLAHARLRNGLTAKLSAEDIAQDTFAAFFQLADVDAIQWEQRGDLWRLLAGIAINKVKQQFERYSASKRSVAKETYSLNHAMEDVAQSLDRDHMATSELTELIDRLLQTEKPLIRRIIQLRLAGYNNHEIAEQTQRSQRTIRRSIERLKARLLVDESGQVQMVAPGEAPEDSSFSRHESFQWLKMIGSGTFSKVYLAKHLATGHLYAIKALRKQLITSRVDRGTFEREFEALKDLDDPGVVKLFGFGRLPQCGCFLVLDWIQGQALSVLLGNRLRPELAKRWANQLTQTVDRLHQHGIAHGDIRADNIMVNDKHQLKLVDFGLSSVSASNHQRKVNDRLMLNRLIRTLNERASTN